MKPSRSGFVNISVGRTAMDYLTRWRDFSSLFLREIGITAMSSDIGDIKAKSLTVCRQVLQGSHS